jgi:hypothetical protein
MATRIRWTDTAIVDAINDWVARYGEVPARIDWDRHMNRRRGHQAKLTRLEAHPRPVPGPTPVLARFGSWEAALAAAGHQPRHATYRPNPAARAATAALYESGHSIAKIADLLALDTKTVRERLDRAGVKRRPRSQAGSAQITECQEQAILAGPTARPRPNSHVTTGYPGTRSKSSASAMDSAADGSCGAFARPCPNTTSP